MHSFVGPVESGDVVTYRAETVDNGGLTTHRVVERTHRGYVTRGDTNPFTDQSAGEPPVKNAQVVAVAWRPGGSVLVLPTFGAVVGGIRDIVGGPPLPRTVASLVGTSALLGPGGVWWLVAGFSAVLYLAGLSATETVSRDSERRTDRESGRDARVLLAGFALLLVAGATVAMVAPAGTTEYEIVSAEFESEQPTVVRAGNATTLTQPVCNTGIAPVRVSVTIKSDGVTLHPKRFALGPGERLRVPVTLDVADVANRTRDLSERLGGGGAETTVVAETRLDGRVNGERVDRRFTHELTLGRGGDTYSLSGPREQSRSFPTRETVTRERQYSLLYRAGGPLLVVVGDAGIVGLLLLRRGDRFELGRVERDWLAYREDYETYEGWIHTVSLPTEAYSLPEAEVATLRDVVNVAIDIEETVIEPPDDDRLHVVDDESRYVYEPPRPDSASNRAVDVLDSQPDSEDDRTDETADRWEHWFPTANSDRRFPGTCHGCDNPLINPSVS